MRRQRLLWNERRIARFGFLVGRGLQAEAVAQELPACSAATVYKHARIFGISFREAERRICLRLSLSSLAPLRPAAEARGCSVEELAARMLKVIAADPSLVNPVLDDGVAG
jgi:hypothetical protein